jgi:energy-coupling factor transporter ATP-binding protein EcfA2
MTATTKSNLTDIARKLVVEGKTNDELWAAFVASGLVSASDTKKQRVYPGWYRGKVMRELGLGKAPASQAAALGELVKKALEAELVGLRAEVTALASAKATVLEVKTGSGPKATTKQIAGAHFLMPRLLKLLDAGFAVYLWGPAGSGKTTAAMQAAKVLSRESEIDTLDPSTFRSMVQGYMTPTGEPVHTTFTRCWTGGKVYIADETDNAPGHVQTLFNSALANGHAPLAWGNVARPDSFSFIGTGNTPGRPTREFPDRKPMSAAFADRLYFLYWPIDPSIECRAAGLTPPKAEPRYETTASAQLWVSFVQSLRAWATVNAPTLMITPRASLAGLKALAAGETPAEVADGLIFRGCDAELKRKALYAVPLP